MSSSSENFKKSLSLTSTTAEKLVSGLSMGVLDVLKGVTGGVSNAILTIANIIDNLGENVSIISRTVASGVGNVSKEVANGLGKVVKRVPLVGGASAYIVKGTGKGIYFIVMTVADVVDTMTNVIGKTAKTSGKVLVFTLGKTEELSENIVVESNNIVSNVLNKVKNSSKTKYSKTKKRSFSK